ncbi:MAG: NAD(P)/FAD-dependent oxidoreductase [Gammaproteobacteria bacterium]|nr:NAD(P)/FAD-dependent oxidoreductase [Gammaproteobacteria bacterium]MCW8910106.1 NAD(P)/FAD-dependent oxidoreductase [Gammaproteobacteria bacterium]MCW9005191.1 NAD(P)/FAD-dependent oxidoreductase [Gammaproteobacteria bacterium]MCW9055866.1 NAD(P)/FAD-dependent oxidoreductase [Gammaproteobacteria bacterium]
MTKQSRRLFLKLSLATASSSLLYAPFIHASTSKHVVIVGGGIGGSTAAKYLRLMDSNIKVTLIEPKKHYTTCFMSNEFLGGERDFKTLEFAYSGLQKHGVSIIHDRVISIDTIKQTVKLSSNKSLNYDRCIVSPGIDFKWDVIEGYDETIAQSIPHAYQAGQQTLTLKKQLESMRNGGTVVIAPPANPFRCPPAPYERASQIAHYLKTHKPKSKIIILDDKEKFSKQKLFEAGWKRHYGYGTDNSMIDWVSVSNGGHIESLDAKNRTISAQAQDFKADVINIIPPQKAGKLAFATGLTDNSGWCPVDHKTFESTLHKNIHVIGDSTIASPLPKSGYAANSEAKVCAAAIVSLFNDRDVLQPSLINTCYSLIAPDDAISVAMVYGYDQGKIIKIKGAGGLTPMDAADHMRKREADYAHSWFNNMTHDIFS